MSKAAVPPDRVTVKVASRVPLSPSVTETSEMNTDPATGASSSRKVPSAVAPSMRVPALAPDRVTVKF